MIGEASSTVMTASELAMIDVDQVEAAVKVIAPPVAAFKVTSPVIPAVLVAGITATTVIVPAEPVAGTKVKPAPTVINANSLLSTAIEVATLGVAANTPPRSIPPHTLMMVADVAAVSLDVDESPKIKSSPVNDIEPMLVDRVDAAAMVTAPLAPAQPTSATTINPLAPLAVNEAVKLMVLLLIILVNTASQVEAVAVTVIEPAVAVPSSRVVESTPASNSSCGIVPAVAVYAISLIVTAVVEVPPIVIPVMAVVTIELSSALLM